MSAICLSYSGPCCAIFLLHSVTPTQIISKLLGSEKMTLGLYVCAVISINVYALIRGNFFVFISTKL